MATKHTPGPWAVDHELPPNGRSVIARVDGIAISGNTEGPHGAGESMPNARLIAAAPEMLEALRRIVEWYEKPCTVTDAYPERMPGIMANAARAAIAKATS